MNALRQLPCIVLLLSTAVAAEPGEAVPLFAANDVVEMTITAPFGEILRERFYNEERAGRLTYIDAERGEVALDVRVRTRGRFRRQADVCPFAPLRLNFKKALTQDTLFEGSDKLKLVTHCRNRSSRHEQAVLREYLAYRIFNLMTDASFRVRLLRVTYVDTSADNRDHTAFAFLIEHRDQLARRIGLEVNDAEAVEIRHLDGAFTNLGSVFQYLIGNTDFSPIRSAEGEPCCHNNVLFGEQRGELLVIPYDFDMSGLASAPYASPNPRFKLRSVRDRLYRGRCANNEYLDASVQAFLARREAIYALITGPAYFNKGSVRMLTRFIDDFYDVVTNPRQLDRRIRRACLGR